MNIERTKQARRDWYSCLAVSTVTAVVFTGGIQLLWMAFTAP